MTTTKTKSTKKKYRSDGPSPMDIHHAIARHVRYSLGKKWDDADSFDLLSALSMSVKDRLTDLMVETEGRYAQAEAKRLYYLSMEFLMGRSLGNNLVNLGMLDTAIETMINTGEDLEAIRGLEEDAALGNGGLGRLAACFLDSLASLDLPGFGYGINYEFGLFQQSIKQGEQIEHPDNWLYRGTPWQVERSDQMVTIPLYGSLEYQTTENEERIPRWVHCHHVMGVPHDMPIVGYGGRTVNYLRLYSARSSKDFDMQIFNDGDYFKAVEQKMSSETISKVLYPSDALDAGKELRLIQEYFLVACSVRDIMRRFEEKHKDALKIPDHVAIQLNDTHPALTVAELTRYLLDEKHLPWETAWEIVTKTLAYTNHTLLPEALEKWPVPLLEKVLPRHLNIIYEINRRFLDEVAVRWPDNSEKMSSMSIIEEGGDKQVRMANLAIIGSHSVNGVAALHSDLVTTQLVPDFYNFWPEKFNNKTNGVTQRRWMLKANPGLGKLLNETIDEKWITNLDLLKKLEPHAEDSAFQGQFMAVKADNKRRLAAKIKQRCDLVVNPDSLFDIHVKRIHEYKRQLLNVMHIIYQYLHCVEDGVAPAAPRTYIFSGKAAPGYWAAKQIIRLIHAVGNVINHDPRVKDMIKVAFLPNYRVSLAEIIIPAADLSEQISTAGMEASGTGNMKLSMNGALTIGTLDGANVEIGEEVGWDNIYIFGLKANEVEEMRCTGSYNPREYYENNTNLRRVMDAINSNRFCPGNESLFSWIFQSVVDQGDFYFHMADLQSYIEAQELVGKEFCDEKLWAKKAILNTARMGKFSSDRTIQQYADEIWGIRPI